MSTRSTARDCRFKRTLSAGAGKLLREPVVQFFALALVLFGGYEYFVGDAGSVSSNRIVIDRDTLLNFMQYRANAFDADLFDRRFDELSSSDMQAIVDDYVREEVLYREALALGFERNDYIIRRRIVQKLEFVLQDSVADSIEPGPGDLENFYERNRADYVEAPIYSFSQVFLDATARGRDPALAAAAETLAALNADSIGPEEAARFGDRPIYFQHYVERSRNFIADYLGASFVAALDAAKVNEDRWIGPIESAFGWHLVKLKEHVPERLPAFTEIETRVFDDYRLSETDRRYRETIDRLRDNYEIVWPGDEF